MKSVLSYTRAKDYEKTTPVSSHATRIKPVAACLTARSNEGKELAKLHYIEHENRGEGHMCLIPQHVRNSQFA